MAATEQRWRCFAGTRRITSWSLSVCVYDTCGRLASVTRDGRAVSSGYDAFLKTGETTPGGDLAWTYDNDFRVTGLTLNGAPCASYAFDDDGTLTRAGDVTLTRDPAAGFLTGTALGNVTDSRTFNGFGEISGFSAAVSGAPLYSAAYTRDALGRLATQTETIGGATVEKAYAYDTRGRLVSVTTGGAVTEWYSYDLNGNKRAQSPRRSRRATAILRPARRAGARSRIRRRSGNCHRTNSLSGAALYDAQDRLLASGDVAFTHDANGSLVSKLLLPPSSLQTSYAYDLFGQLKSVTLPDGRVVSYDRDALNRVTAKRVNGAIVKGWIYKDGLKPIAETDASGNIVSLFVYGTSALSPDYMVKDGVTYRFIRDVQGSVRLVVDAATGAVAQRLDYDSFGNVLQDTNPGFQPFGFQSGLYDSATGLVHFGARWYDPVSGRWLSKDPILLEGGLNLYAFCGNDPVNFSDPSGLCDEQNFRDGEAEAQKYVDLLQRDKYKLLNMFAHGDLSEMNAWSTQDDKDLASKVDEMFGYRCRVLNGPQQGNVDAAYAFTYVFHTLIAGVVVSIAGEAAGYLSGVSDWNDAKGSFAANWIGIKEVAKDLLVEDSIRIILNLVF